MRDWNGYFVTNRLLRILSTITNPSTKVRRALTEFGSRNYLKRFSDACHYELYKIQGLPIGSGEVESAFNLV
jgi:hypothetical protein